jgi:hypothetical protein
MRRAHLGAACAAMLALCQSASAGVMIISLDPNTHTPSDVPFNDIGGNPVSVFGWLQGEILSWNNNIGTPTLPDPTTGHIRQENLTSGPTVQVEAGDYIVAHYGVGPNGVPGTGGGLVAYYADASQSFTLPSSGGGPNGTGGISFVDVWDHTGGGPGPGGGGSVPDGGSTLAMLGMSLAAVGFARSQRKARA